MLVEMNLCTAEEFAHCGVTGTGQRGCEAGHLQSCSSSGHLTAPNPFLRSCFCLFLPLSNVNTTAVQEEKDPGVFDVAEEA